MSGGSCAGSRIEGGCPVFEIFEHTADLGLRVRAPSLERLCEDAAAGLMQIIAGDVAQIRPDEPETFELSGRRPDYLLFDWLNELLYVFGSRRMLFSRFEVAPGVEERGLRATAFGERYDPARHTLAHEVKAITYHGLTVKRPGDSGGQWEATVIVDI